MRGEKKIYDNTICILGYLVYENNPRSTRASGQSLGTEPRDRTTGQNLMIRAE